MEILTSKYFWYAFGISILLPLVQRHFNKSNDIDIEAAKRARDLKYPIYYPFLYFIFILFVIGIILTFTVLVAWYSWNFLISESFSGYIDQQQLSVLQLILFIIYASLPLLLALLTFGLLLMRSLTRILPNRFQQYDLKRMYEAGWRASDSTIENKLWRFNLSLGILFLAMTILFYLEVLHF